MMATGTIIMLMEKESSTILTEMYMREAIAIIKCKARASTATPIRLRSTRAPGKTTYSRAEVRKLSLTLMMRRPQCTRAILKMGQSQERASTHGQMALTITDSGPIARCTATAFTTMKTEGLTSASFNRATPQGTEFISMRTASDTTGNLKTILRQATVFTTGQTAASTRATGPKENNTA